jgi:NAD(P)-dependent dehydrogenase (short-subunit alcohol dehydrogenase family)
MEITVSTILITGANRGLGLEFTRQYLADGWRVLAASRQPGDELSSLAAQHDSLSLHALDVSDHAQIDGLAAELRNQPLDVLLNNAGFFGTPGFADGGVEAQSFGNSDFDDWARVYRVNVMGPMKMAEAFVEQVAASEQRKIVTLTSMLGSMGLNNIGGLYAYRSSKAAVNAVMHSMGIDLRKRGILAAAVHPGWARTGMGGPQAELDSETAVRGVRQVIANLNEDSLGHVTAYSGEALPY